MKFLGLYRSERFHYREGLWTKLPKTAFHLGETLSQKKKLKAIKMNPVFAPLHAEQGETETSGWVHFNMIPKGHADGIIYWNIHEKQMKTNLD